MIGAHQRLLGGSVLFFALLVWGCQPSVETDVDHTPDGTVQLGAVEAVDTLARAVALSGRPLTVNGFRGAVAIRGNSRSTAELAFVRRGRGADADAARAALDDIGVSESGSQDTYSYTLESGRQSAAFAAVDVSGTVPEETTLRVEKTSGPVTLSGIAGPLTVQQDHGPVTVYGAAASVDVSVQNGDITAGFRALPSSAEVSLETANGDVTVRLPPGAGATLDAQTNVGGIRTEGLPLTDERFNPVDAGGRYRASVGGGGATVDVRTNNGTIQFLVADTSETVVPSPDTLAVPPSDTTVAPQAPPDTADTPAADTMGVDTTAFDTTQGGP